MKDLSHPHIGEAAETEVKPLSLYPEGGFRLDIRRALGLLERAVVGERKGRSMPKKQPLIGARALLGVIIYLLPHPHFYL